MVLTSVKYSRTQNYTGKTSVISSNSLLFMIQAKSQETLENQKLQNVEVLDIAYKIVEQF
jgi:hypothetical protein